MKSHRHVPVNTLLAVMPVLKACVTVQPDTEVVQPVARFSGVFQ